MNDLQRANFSYCQGILENLEQPFNRELQPVTNLVSDLLKGKLSIVRNTEKSNRTVADF